MSALTLSQNHFVDANPANIWFAPNASSPALPCCASISGVFDFTLEQETFFHSKLGSLSRADLEQASQYQRLQRMVALQTSLALSVLTLDAPLMESQLKETLQQAAQMSMDAINDFLTDGYGAQIVALTISGITVSDGSSTPLCAWEAPTIAAPAAVATPTTAAPVAAAAPASTSNSPWTCGNCGAGGMTGAFCGNCGTPRP